MPMTYRYPGMQPFQASDKDLFFGRKKDIENLFQAVLLNQITVIVGPSGAGKSSLINAGLLPKIDEEINRKQGEKRKFRLLRIRVGNRKENETLNLVEKILAVEIENPIPSADEKEQQETDNEFLSFLTSSQKTNLWYKFKQLQYDALLHRQKTIYLFLFDQLEELFTYPSTQFKALLNELAQLVSPNTPEAIRNSILEKQQQDENFLKEEEIQTLETSIPIKFVFAIRSDRLSLLIRLREAMPAILQNPYELRPLLPEQATEAIIGPTKLQLENVASITYQPETVELICNYLQKRPNTNNEIGVEGLIEPFALQIICSHIEQNLQQLDKDADKIISKEEIADLDKIIEQFYLSAIERLGLDEKLRMDARRLIEEVMVDERYHRKKTEFKDEIITKHNIPEDVLQKLVDFRLLREIASSYPVPIYELTHDCLIEPILNAKKIRLDTNSMERAEKFDETASRLEEDIRKNPNDYSLYKRLGDYYYFLQNYNEAKVKYSQAIRLKEQLGIKTGEIDLFFNRADCFLKLKEYGSSNQDLKVVLDIEPRHLLANYYMGYNCHMMKDYLLAKEFYRKVIEIDSSYSDAYYNLGLVCEGLNDPENSHQYFLKTIELNPKDFEAYYRLGLLLATKLAKPDEAIVYFNKSIELNEGFEDAYVQLAYTYAFDLLDKEKAIDLLNSLTERNAQNKDAWKWLGYIYQSMKKYTEASESFYKSISLDPTDADVFYQLCSLANDQGKYANAISFANSCLRLDVNHINAYLEKGYAHRMLQQLDESIACYQKVLELDRKNETATRNLQAIHQYEENEVELIKLINKNPDDAVSLFELGVLSNNKQKYNEAIEYFKKTLEIKPGDTEALLEMAYAYYQLKEINKAIEAYKKIIEINPKDAAAYLSLGKVYDSLRQFDEAKSYLEKAVELDPTDQDSLYRLGLIANDRKEFDKAIGFFERTLKIKPDHTNALIEKGYAFYTSNRFEESLNCYKTILIYEPNNSKAYYGLGISYNMLNNFEEASQNFLKAVELNPSYANAYNGLGLIAYGEKDYEKAISYFEHYIALEPDNTQAYDYLAYCCMQIGDYETAGKYYKHLVQLDPQHADWNFNLGLAMKHMKNAEEALIYFKNALALQRNDAEAMFTIGEIYKELNNEQEAESYFQQAAALDPKYAYEIQKEPTINSSSL